jgi:hypothetical protein
MIPTSNWSFWTRNFWTRKHIAVAAAIVVLTTGGAYSFGLARGKPYSSAVLTDQWQCTRTAGILTVCTKRAG